MNVNKKWMRVVAWAVVIAMVVTSALLVMEFF